MKKETKTATQTAVPEKPAAPERVHGLDLISKYRGAIMGKMFEQQRPGWLINLAVLLAITAVSFAAHFLFQQFWKLVDWLIGMIPKPGKKAAAEQSK